MSGFVYKVVPFVGKIKGSGAAGEVSNQLQSVINSVAAEGWDLVTMADVGIEVSPGCLGKLLGKEMNYVRYDQLIFRRPAA
jgi:hypothetical protein